MSSNYFNVLFIDRENASFSVIAERLLQHWGQGRFKAYSAGVEPASAIDPLAIQLLHAKKFPVEGLRSKSWREFAGRDAPHFDFVITLTDDNQIRLPGKWIDNPVVAHWNLHDALIGEAHQDDPLYRLRQTYSFLENRIKIFSNLKLGGFNRKALTRELDAISNFKLDDELLDNEHELFFFLSRRLTHAVQEGKSHDVLINIAHEIQKYAQFHFFSEENYMEEEGFPGLQDHCALHAKLMSDLNEKVFKWMADQVAFREVSIFLEDWFLQHTLQEDAKFIDYLATRRSVQLPQSNSNSPAVTATPDDMLETAE